MKTSTSLFGLGGLLFCLAGFSLQEGQPTEAAFEPSPEAILAMSPGPMHEYLAPLVGEWQAQLAWRMSPDAPWTEFDHQAERELTMDGRYLEETYKGEWMGEPFQGRCIIGYDNVREEFTNIWYDNMSTGMSISTGQASKDGKVITFEGQHSDPMSGEKDAWVRSVMKIVGPDKNVVEMSTEDENGDAFVSMRITYTR